jgi:hypothetical protein
MTPITRILRWSSEWSTIKLACGHERRIRRSELASRQLYVGKGVECEECYARKKPGKAQGRSGRERGQVA